MFPLREPEKLSLGRYLDFEGQIKEANDLDRLLHFVHSYASRSFDLYGLKQRGSEAGHETWLRARADNLWSVLRNLEGQGSVDDRYQTILEFMRKAFPKTFDGLLLEPTGPNVVYGSFLDKHLSKPVLASGASDGHIQLLILLTALFSEGQDRDSLLLMDEPETSLHPWALSVFAEAVKLATSQWNKQVILATHSPVLISQFDAEDTWTADIESGRTRLRQLSTVREADDLLRQYSAGSLYMADLLAPQRELETASEVHPS